MQVGELRGILGQYSDKEEVMIYDSNFGEYLTITGLELEESARGGMQVTVIVCDE